MTVNVMYTPDWNDLTRRPVAGNKWLTTDDAHNRASQSELTVAVDAARVDNEGQPYPRWTIGFRLPGRMRVTFYNQKLSVWRQVDWDLIDGQLWRWITVDYEYHDDIRQWAEDESVVSCKTVLRTNGSGYINVSSRTPKHKVKKQFTDRASSGIWLALPEFGEWDELTATGPSAYELAGLTTTGKAAQEELASWPTV